MKLSRKILALCAFIAGAGWAAVSLAAEPLPPNADQPPFNDKTCTRCHDEGEVKPIWSLYQSKMGVRADPHAPNCQSCHGGSRRHLYGDVGINSKLSPDVVFGTRLMPDSFPPSPVEKQNASCLACHKKDANRSQWEGSTHQSRGLACPSCHEIHALKDRVRDKRTQPEVCFNCHKDKRGQINRPSHHPIPEGKMACSDCHNPHGSAGPKLMKRDTINDTCYTCHMEKRGPFVHNHEPVNDDCTICHNPHGTTAESMLKTRPPFLCQTCHKPHGAVQPLLAGQVPPPNSVTYGSGSAITQGRACLNCHTLVHGSNNPGLAPANGQFFFR